MLLTYLSIVETPEERSLFEQIYYTYRKQMFFVANGILDNEILAEDALQEAFMGIAKQITLFRDMPENNRKAYVLTAAKNAADTFGLSEKDFSFKISSAFTEDNMIEFRSVTVYISEKLHERRIKEIKSHFESLLNCSVEVKRGRFAGTSLKTITSTLSSDCLPIFSLVLVSPQLSWY